MLHVTTLHINVTERVLPLVRNMLLRISYETKLKLEASFIVLIIPFIIVIIVVVVLLSTRLSLLADASSCDDDDEEEEGGGDHGHCGYLGSTGCQIGQ